MTAGGGAGGAVPLGPDSSEGSRRAEGSRTAMFYLTEEAREGRVTFLCHRGASATEESYWMLSCHSWVGKRTSGFFP